MFLLRKRLQSLAQLCGSYVDWGTAVQQIVVDRCQEISDENDKKKHLSKNAAISIQLMLVKFQYSKNLHE